MTSPLDPVLYPEGSQVRQEKERELAELHEELAESSLSEVDGPGEPTVVPEEIWRGNG
jgi:hypothetical protein